LYLSVRKSHEVMVEVSANAGVRATRAGALKDVVPLRLARGDACCRFITSGEDEAVGLRNGHTRKTLIPRCNELPVMDAVELDTHTGAGAELGPVEARRSCFE
jgi:hypothetical protein